MADEDAGTSRRTWPRWLFCAFAVLALVLLLAEHRAHAWGWAVHALLGLCVVLPYLVIRADERDRDAHR